MKNLSNKFKEGANKVWDKGKKIALPVIGSVIISYAATQDADAQKRKKFPKNHDYGAYFTVDKSGNKWNLEEKVFYGDRYYVQRTEKTEDNELGLIFYDAHKVKLILDAETKEPKELRTDKQIIFKPVGTKLKLSQKGPYKVRAGGLCDDQIAEKAGVSENEPGYIVTVNIKDFLPDIKTVVINGVEYYWPMVAEDKLNEEGKTNNYLAIRDSTDLEIDYATKYISMLSTIYRGIEQELEEEKRIKLIPGQGVKLSTGPVEKKVKEGDKKVKDSKEKGTLYLMINGEASFDHLTGGVGIGGDHLKLKFNYGKGFDENLLDITTPVSPSGRYGQGTKDNIDIKVIGGDISYSFGDNWQFGIGAGANKWDYTQKSVERIMSTQNIIKENINSVSKSEVSGKAYVEVTKKIGNFLKLSGFTGYDTKAKIIGGITVQVPINKK